jgi:hypothetical protein
MKFNILLLTIFSITLVSSTTCNLNQITCGNLCCNTNSKCIKIGELFNCKTKKEIGKEKNIKTLKNMLYDLITISDETFLYLIYTIFITICCSISTIRK